MSLRACGSRPSRTARRRVECGRRFARKRTPTDSVPIGTLQQKVDIVKHVARKIGIAKEAADAAIGAVFASITGGGILSLFVDGAARTAVRADEEPPMPVTETNRSP